MRYDYVVALKRENARQTDFASFFLLLFSVLAFIIVQIRSFHFSFFLSIAAFILLAGIFINITASRKGKEMYFRNWLLAAGLFWIGMPFFQWMTGLFIFFAILERKAKHPPEFGFGTTGILINNFIKKKILWNELESVILKDSILTLNFKNDKILQEEVLDGKERDEDEFNRYCREQLEKVDR